ncbi:MAG: ABC transporter substrate-binding protein [Vicinamibacterales bacterium]
MDRRTFISTMSCGVVAAPLIATAQTGTTVRRIGYLVPGAPETPAELQQTFAPLRKLGWIEGQNVHFERRYANGRAELLHPLAEELVRLKVELIVTEGTPATLAAKNATNTIPIVFWSAGDPVRSGLVATLAKPDGNVTGFAIIGSEMDAKRLQVLRELLPSVQRVGVLENSTNPHYRAVREDLEQAARALGMQPIFVEVATAGELANGVAEIARRGGQAMLIGPDNLFNENRVELMQAALKHSLPTTVSRLYIRETGALISYAPAEAEHDARAAAFIDRILRGAKPADLPVEQPSKFLLIINLRTAKVLGVTVPQSLLLRADEVIQ